MTQKEREVASKWYNEIAKKTLTKKEELLMNIITQEARKKQEIVKQAIKMGKAKRAENTE